MVQDILGQLGFDWKVALANLVNFLIIYYLLRNVVFKRIGSAIRERQENVKKGIEDAREAKESLEQAEKEKEKIITDAYKEAHLIADKSEKDRLALIKEARLSAEEEAQKIKEKGLRDLENEKLRAEKELKTAYVDLIIDGIEKISREEIRSKESEKFANSLLK